MIAAKMELVRFWGQPPSPLSGFMPAMYRLYWSLFSTYWRYTNKIIIIIIIIIIHGRTASMVSHGASRKLKLKL